VAEFNSNMEIEELFRSKLENAEFIPGEGVRAELMRKVGWKEFLRFNPYRFNAYYMAGIAAAAISTAVIFGPSNEQKPGRDDTVLLPEQEIISAPGPVASEDLKAGGDNKTAAEVKIEKNSKPENPIIILKDTVATAGNEAVINLQNDSIVRGVDTPAKSEIIMKKLTGDNISKYQLQKKTISSFTVSLSAGCLPLKVKFMNKSAGWDSCRWIFGDGGYSTDPDPVWLFDVPGEYKVTLKVFGPDGSESSSTQLLNVYPRPKARFEIEPQAPIIPDDQIRFVNYSMDAARYRWEFGDGKISDALEPEHKYNRYGCYNVRLIVWSEHGCSDSLLLTDAFAASGCYINFPNAFIPNPHGPSGGNYSNKSDESAEIFHPVTSGVSEYQLRIFSKKGILIFETNDINTGWDGYHKGQLCETGVYVWKVRGSYKNGESFVKMGDIILLKN
jgi:PKD repeat protein